ncbi:hypothetical protein Pan241w_45930 [Gimesia alba]|uniref:Uncharacterized protein n=1 Tax=Gimesia alba TaxID=2527973 RepID=A0A517RKR7_9PLAN|nr:hypothetical protein [Gimesia alba]QDT44483.1 hypothetical protein Pan241w_45930 [Gimesia alba]
MDDSSKTISDFKEAFETAIKKYDLQIIIRVMIAWIMLFLLMFVLALIIRYFQTDLNEFLGIDSGATDCPKGTSSLFIFPIFLISAIVPITFLFRQAKQLRQNTGPHCPSCHVFLAKWRFRQLVLMTGFCPVCMARLFKGKLDSEAAAIAHYQKTKTESNGLVRFIVLVTLTGILIGIPVSLWLRQTNALLGKEVASIFSTLCLVIVMFSLMPVSLSMILKFSIRDTHECVTLLNEVSHDVSQSGESIEHESGER